MLEAYYAYEWIEILTMALASDKIFSNGTDSNRNDLQASETEIIYKRGR